MVRAKVALDSERSRQALKIPPLLFQEPMIVPASQSYTGSEAYFSFWIFLIYENSPHCLVVKPFDFPATWRHSVP